MAGVTEQGGLVIAPLGGPARTLLAEGSGVQDLAFAPDGQLLAAGRAGAGIQVVDVTTGRTVTVFHQPDPRLIPRVAGWSPDGRSILYWRGPVGKEAAPLDAVPAGGGGWVNLFDAVLPYRDFVSRCGQRVALSGGGGQAVTQGKQILLTGPPSWQFHNLTHDYVRSWLWPACSADGRWVAAIATPNKEESPDLAAPRALWLLASDGSSRHRLIAGGEDAVEFPRWSAGGNDLLVVLRSASEWSAPGRLILLQVDPRSGRVLGRLGPIAELGPAPGPGGHQAWAEVSDWYRPG
jgi:dipeptidyl aminopeptidase/acylaminoacyl peptidase